MGPPGRAVNNEQQVPQSYIGQTRPNLGPDVRRRDEPVLVREDPSFALVSDEQEPFSVPYRAPPLSPAYNESSYLGLDDIQMDLRGTQPANLDETDGPSQSSLHTNVRVNISTNQEVCDSTPDLFTSFIVDRMEYDGYKVPPSLSNKSKKNESAIASVLQHMGDTISRNYELNHLISEIQVTPNTAYKTFASVACQIFTDGNINWGRVVMLFYFAYKLALQVLNQLPLIDIIIGWVSQFIRERIASWIARQGGWAAIREYYGHYYGSTNGQMVGVFLAGILVSTLFWYWRK